MDEVLRSNSGYTSNHNWSYFEDNTNVATLEIGWLNGVVDTGETGLRIGYHERICINLRKQRIQREEKVLEIHAKSTFADIALRLLIISCNFQAVHISHCPVSDYFGHLLKVPYSMQP